MTKQILFFASSLIVFCGGDVGAVNAGDRSSFANYHVCVENEISTAPNRLNRLTTIADVVDGALKICRPVLEVEVSSFLLRYPEEDFHVVAQIVQESTRNLVNHTFLEILEGSK